MSTVSLKMVKSYLALARCCIPQDAQAALINAELLFFSECRKKAASSECYRRPRPTGDPNPYHIGDPDIFIGDPKVFIGDPK